MTTIDATVAYLMGRYRAILRIHGNSSMERREAEEDDFQAALRTALTAAGGDADGERFRVVVTALLDPDGDVAKRLVAGKVPGTIDEIRSLIDAAIQKEAK